MYQYGGYMLCYDITNAALHMTKDANSIEKKTLNLNLRLRIRID